MKRKSLAAFVLVLLAVSAAAVVQAPRSDREALEAIGQILVDQGIVLPTTTTRPTTTTSTRPPSTTTTPTTTTAPPTTTVPPTTTTLPTPSGERFIIMLINADTGETWWEATYFRNLPFYPNTGWTDGERAGYKCAYMFLLQDGQPVGRVTFTRVDGANYAKVNDQYMKEGARHFDGSLPPPPVSQAECPAPVQAYEPYTGPDERPVITYNTASGQLLEVRDYTKTVTHVDVKFRVVEVSADRVTVVAYVNDLPALVIYYDSLGSTVMGSSIEP